MDSRWSQTMRRRAFVAAALAASSCSRRGRDGRLRPVSVGLTNHLSVSSVHLADEGGHFRAAGFEFNPIQLTPLQAVPLLADGKLDVFLGGIPPSLTNAVAKAMPVRVVAGREYASPSCGEGYVLYAHRGAFADGAVDPKRLKGKRFSVRVRGITEFILDAFLQAHEMRPDDVQRVDLPLSESLAALAGNKVDALFDIETSRSPLAMSPDIVKVWRYSSIQPLHQYSFIVFGTSILREGSGTGSRFLAAYLKAAGEFIDGRTPKFMREFAAKHQLDVEKVVNECRNTFPRDGAIDLPSIQRTIDWQLRRGYATQKVTVEQLVDGSYLKEARDLLASGRWRVNASDPRGNS